eukprot:8889750-Pyramimonas_sp.AAC.1
MGLLVAPVTPCVAAACCREHRSAAPVGARGSGGQSRSSAQSLFHYRSEKGHAPKQQWSTRSCM